MKKLIAFLLLSLTTTIFCADLKVTKYVPKESENDFGKISYYIFHTDKENKFVKIESMLTDAFAKEMGFYYQVTNFIDGKEYSFEMYSTEKKVELTGITKRTDFVDEQDTIISVNYAFDNAVEYDITGSNFTLIDNYTITTLSYYKSLLLESNPNDATYSYEGSIFKGMTNIITQNLIRDISKDEMQVIKGWQVMHFNVDYSDLYKEMVFVSDNRSEYWIAVQKSLIEEIKQYSNIMAYYYYIGGYGKDPMFLVIGFLEP